MALQAYSVLVVTDVEKDSLGGIIWKLTLDGASLLHPR
jgi:hypothetical protein